MWTCNAQPTQLLLDGNGHSIVHRGQQSATQFATGGAKHTRRAGAISRQARNALHACIRTEVDLRRRRAIIRPPVAAPSAEPGSLALAGSASDGHLGWEGLETDGRAGLTQVLGLLKPGATSRIVLKKNSTVLHKYHD